MFTICALHDGGIFATISGIHGITGKETSHIIP